jgi:hypothetical protein
VTEQSSGGRVLVLEGMAGKVAERSLGEDLRIVGAWSPRNSEPRGARPESWGRPTEVRLRRGADGVPRLLTCDSFGAVIVLDPETGRHDWVDAGPDANPHAIELLPDGSTVVAASTGGWIRRYDLQLPGPPVILAELLVPDAHGLWWDAHTESLWALGGSQLLRLGIEPTRFVRIAAWQLPSSHGHDLRPVQYAGRRLWVTTGTEVLQFAIDEGRFERVAWIAGDAGAGVKSIDGGATSGIIMAKPSSCMESEWLTDRIVAFRGKKGRPLRAPAQFYKARKWEEIE